MTAPASATYCAESDITLGDMQPPRTVSIQQWIQNSADHMNSYIGQMYVLPLELDPLRPDHMADILLLRRINVWLTTGQIFMQSNAGSEDSNFHVYGKWMYDEAQKELARITAGRTVLESAEPLNPVDNQPNGPIITNRDAVSFVDSFYMSKGTAHLGSESWGVTGG